MGRLLLVTAILLAGLMPTMAPAQQGLSPAQQAEGRHALQTARNLISYGEAKGDALALVMAVRLIASVPGRVLADGQTGAAGPGKSVAFDVEAILRKAEQASRGDPLIAKAIADLRTAATADEEPTCYWEYYCYFNGECEYSYTCW